MTQTFTVPGPLPGMNEFTGKGSRWVYTGLKQKWGGICTQSILAAKLRPMPWAIVRCAWFEPSAKRDPDNIAVGLKFVLDALTHAKVLPNDGFVNVLEIHHRFAVDRHDPRVEVTLEGQP
jgi:hypothetical protein